VCMAAPPPSSLLPPPPAAMLEPPAPPRLTNSRCWRGVHAVCSFLAMDALAEDCRTMAATPPERARFLQEWDADADVAHTKSQLAQAAKSWGKGKGKK
jgi:hypothetical protein